MTYPGENHCNKDQKSKKCSASNLPHTQALSLGNRLSWKVIMSDSMYERWVRGKNSGWTQYRIGNQMRALAIGNWQWDKNWQKDPSISQGTYHILRPLGNGLIAHTVVVLFVRSTRYLPNQSFCAGQAAYGQWQWLPECEWRCGAK
jgi:hypothetical protein